MPNDEPIDAQFIDATPVQRAPEPTKCKCPACPIAVMPPARWCPTCLGTCVPALRKIHAAHPAIRQGAGDAKAIADGVKSAARVVDGALDLVSVFTGEATATEAAMTALLALVAGAFIAAVIITLGELYLRRRP